MLGVLVSIIALRLVEVTLIRAPGLDPLVASLICSAVWVAAIAMLMRHLRAGPRLVATDARLVRRAVLALAAGITVVSIGGALLVFVERGDVSIGLTHLGDGDLLLMSAVVVRAVLFVVVEELLFRGVLLRAAMRVFRTDIHANRLQAAVFAVGHAIESGPAALAWTYIMGSLYGKAVLVKGSLAIGVVLHGVHNSLHFLLLRHTCVAGGLFTCESALAKFLFYLVVLGWLGAFVYLGRILLSRNAATGAPGVAEPARRI